jgi:hypothetical protein
MKKTDIEILKQMFDSNHLNHTEIKRANELVHIFNSYLKPFNTYNGWTNYETWRINLEIFDGLNILDFYPDAKPDLYELAVFLDEYVQDLINEGGNELAISYASAFISNVNWSEIAVHLIENKE